MSGDLSNLKPYTVTQERAMECDAFVGWSWFIIVRDRQRIHAMTREDSSNEANQIAALLNDAYQAGIKKALDTMGQP